MSLKETLRSLKDMQRERFFVLAEERKLFGRHITLPEDVNHVHHGCRRLRVRQLRRARHRWGGMEGV